MIANLLGRLWCNVFGHSAKRKTFAWNGNTFRVCARCLRQAGTIA